MGTRVTLEMSLEQAGTLERVLDEAIHNRFEVNETLRHLRMLRNDLRGACEQGIVEDVPIKRGELCSNCGGAGFCPPRGIIGTKTCQSCNGRGLIQ